MDFGNRIVELATSEDWLDQQHQDEETDLRRTHNAEIRSKDAKFTKLTACSSRSAVYLRPKIP